MTMVDRHPYWTDVLPAPTRPPEGMWLPMADADIRITPAEGFNAKPGESDLVIAWKQGMPFRVNLSIDDSGSKRTGKYQGDVTLSYDHWWTLNDLFYVSLNHDLGGGHSGEKGTRGYTVYYEVPYGFWLLGFTASRYNYHQTVAGAFQRYLYSGKSENSEIRLSRLFYRDAVRKPRRFETDSTVAGFNLTYLY